VPERRIRLLYGTLAAVYLQCLNRIYSLNRYESQRECPRGMQLAPHMQELQTSRRGNQCPIAILNCRITVQNDRCTIRPWLTFSVMTEFRVRMRVLLFVHGWSSALQPATCFMATTVRGVDSYPRGMVLFAHMQELQARRCDISNNSLECKPLLQNAHRAVDPAC
jgi:hypothetical protein